MSLLRLFICLAILFTSCQAIAKSANPFDKTVVVTAGHDVTWQIGEQTATKSVKGPDGTWYHLFYDGLLFRLRLTGSSHDSQYAAKQFEDFAVLDVKIDGNRLDVFQWCLNNQEKHNRYLQQGLSVRKEVCQNVGEQGSYVMRLTRKTLDALDKGNMIEFELKPYRTKIQVKFSIDDFYKVNNEFKKQYEAKLAASRPTAEQAPAAPVAQVAASTSKPKCKIEPPRGFSEVRTISYDCDDVAAKNSARASVDSEVNKIREQRNKAEAEAERKRKEAEAARLAREEALRKEQEVLAASAAAQAELSSEIAIKMIALCEKSWAEGEHRCYCEKYIKYAPSSIKSDSSCK